MYCRKNYERNLWTRTPYKTLYKILQTKTYVKRLENEQIQLQFIYSKIKLNYKTRLEYREDV